MSTRLVLATSFPVHPARGGGQVRILGLYKALAELGVSTELVCLVDRGRTARRVELAPRLVQVEIPKTPEHEAAEFELERASHTVVTDAALPLIHDLTPDYGRAIAAAAAGADAAVASHPYAYPAIRAACDLPVVYEAHNVERDLKAPVLSGTEQGRRLLDEIERVEGACARDAALIMACLEDDAARLEACYGIRGDEVVVVPNGVDLSAIAYTEPAARRALRDALGLDTPLALFVGSWHPPNVEALDDVLAAAPRVPGLRFLVVGSIGASLGHRPVPPNVDVCGMVEHGFLTSVLAVAGRALNPMRSGSGTNLKMLDYAAAGVPIVSTPFGARGLGLEPGRHYAAAEGDELAGVLAEFDDAAAAPRVRAARAHVAEHFGWGAIARRLVESAGWSALVERAHRGLVSR